MTLSGKMIELRKVNGMTQDKLASSCRVTRKDNVRLTKTCALAITGFPDGFNAIGK